MPIYHVKRHKALAVRIAELTEDLEELRSEKALLVQKFEYAEDAGAEAFRKDIAIMEVGLKKLEAQEQKYSAELDKALDEYAELKAQAADFDSVELYKARQVLRPAQEKAAERQLEETCRRSLRSVCCSAPSRKHRVCLERTQKSGRHGNSLCGGRKNREQFRKISPRKKSIGRDNVRRRRHRSSRRPYYSISCSNSVNRFDAKNS